MSEGIIRLAVIEDAIHIQAILAPYIRETVFNLEEQLKAVSHYEHLISSTLTRYPFFVFEYQGQVIGFVYASQLNPVLHLSKSCMLSIYVSQHSPLKGVGQRLLTALELALMNQGVEHLIANIVRDNQRSIAFHQKNGYEEIAMFEHAGQKFGELYDVVWLGKHLSMHLTTYPSNYLDTMVYETDQLFEG